MTVIFLLYYRCNHITRGIQKIILENKKNKNDVQVEKIVV